MKLKQLAVFLENKPGQLLAPVQALADAGISILTLSLADTSDYGILRLIVEDVEKAKKVLADAGCVLSECEVLAVEVPDRPGGLAQVLAPVSGAELSLEYMYAFSFGPSGKALLVFRFDQPDKAIEILLKAGVNVLDRNTLFSHANQPS